MRSKEVEEAINQLIVDINFSEAGCSTGIIDVKNIDTVLSYISELEKDSIHWRGKYHLVSRKPDITIKILIKIQELEKELQEYEESDMEVDEDYLFDTNAMRSTIQVLKEIIGE